MFSLKITSVLVKVAVQTFECYIRSNFEVLNDVIKVRKRLSNARVSFKLIIGAEVIRLAVHGAASYRFQFKFHAILRDSIHWRMRW